MLIEWVLYKNNNTGFIDVVSYKDYKEIMFYAKQRGEDISNFEILKRENGGKKTLSKLLKLSYNL